MTTENEISKVLECLAPWIEKTDGEESVGSWETTMATKMMVKLLELWLTQESRDKVAKMLEYYHPLDRAAMAYALVVYVMTGTKMTFKSAMATQHFKTISQMLKADMPTLMFAGHMKYMMRRYAAEALCLSRTELRCSVYRDASLATDSSGGQLLVW